MNFGFMQRLFEFSAPNGAENSGTFGYGTDRIIMNFRFMRRLLGIRRMVMGKREGVAEPPVPVSCKEVS